MNTKHYFKISVYFIKGKKKGIQTYPALTDCATLGSKNCTEVFNNNW